MFAKTVLTMFYLKNLDFQQIAILTEAASRERGREIRTWGWLLFPDVISKFLSAETVVFVAQRMQESVTLAEIQTLVKSQ